jgi:hypothetical protein
MFTPTVQEQVKSFSDVVKHPIDPNFSFNEGIIASGAGVLKLGTVLGRITASGKYVLHDNALANGAEVAAAILGEAVDATAADVRALVVEWGTIVVLPELTFKAGISAPNKTAAIASLATQKILARDV